MVEDDERAVSSQSVSAHTDVPEPAPAARVDLNSRIETRLWLLRKGADKAEARMCAKFGRRDFRIYVNGGLLWSRNYALDERQHFDEHAAAKRDEFLSLGWEPLGDTPRAE